MPSANAGPIDGSELIKFIQDGWAVWLNRTQFSLLVTMAAAYAPRPFARPTTLTGAEQFEALQRGTKITMTVTDLTAWMAGSAPPSTAPGVQAGAITGRENASALQAAYHVGLNIADVATVRAGGGAVTDLLPGQTPASTMGFGVNLGSLTGSKNPLIPSTFENADGSFNGAAVGQMLLRMNDMGMDWCRLSYFSADDTAALSPPIIDRLGGVLYFLNANKKKVIVDVAVPGMYDLSQLTGSGVYANYTVAQLEQMGYDYIHDAVLYFHDNVVAWSFKNEGNLGIRLAQGQAPLFGQGMTAAEFDSPMAQRLIAIERGIARAVHEFGGKIIMNTTNINMGWIQLHIDNGAAPDMLEFHGYEDKNFLYTQQIGGVPAPMDIPRFGVKAGDTVFNLPTMWNSFGLPYIFGEVNGAERYNTNQTRTNADPSNVAADISLMSQVDQLVALRLPLLKACLVYELYDEPNLANTSERHFGLYFDNAHPKTSARLMQLRGNPTGSPIVPLDP